MPLKHRVRQEGLLDPPPERRTEIKDPVGYAKQFVKAAYEAYMTPSESAKQLGGVEMPSGRTMYVSPEDFLGVGVTKFKQGTKVFRGGAITEKVEKSKAIDDIISTLIERKYALPFQRHDLRKQLMEEVAEDTGSFAVGQGILRSLRSGKIQPVGVAERASLQKRVASVAAKNPGKSDKWIFDTAYREHINEFYGVASSGSLTALQSSREFTPMVHAAVARKTSHQPYKHAADPKAGTGAGGDLWDKGIYFSDSTEVAGRYAEWASGKGKPYVRTANIPPQAKILDLSKPLTPEVAMAIIKHGNIPAYARDDILNQLVNIRQGVAAPSIHDVATQVRVNKRFRKIAEVLGYDGIAFPAGQARQSGSKAHKPATNYVIYNYDVINNPNRLAVERGFKRATE